QYFGRSLITTNEKFLSNVNDLAIQYQGSLWIPSQSYLDLHGSWRVLARNLGALDELTIDAAIVNVLDKAPPRESSLAAHGPSCSRYGDPRQRRFELGLSAHF